MSHKRSGRGRQSELFPRSRRPTIPIDENHPLLRMTDDLEWPELVERAEELRRTKVKSAAGRPPHLRALLGALIFMAQRRLTYREAEDQIRHYAPARYLCALTETDWTPDFTTIQDFTELMGEEGIRLLNEYVVGLAVEKKLADPRVVVADTTAQEAAIPHPNEMGLMSRFVGSLRSLGRRAGQKVRGFIERAAAAFKAVKDKLRKYRLTARASTKQAKDRMVSEMATLVDGVCQGLGDALAASKRGASRLRGFGIVARRGLLGLHDTMVRLLPQIRHWLRTGRVATGKIINLYVPQLYAMVRGKVGKAVEFGLHWGITRLKGGFLLATLAQDRAELVDTKFVRRAVEDLVALFGKPPRAFAYDRAGYSAQNVDSLRRLGVRQIALAPRGLAQWSVRGRVRKQLVRERALVEAGIGTIKCARYGFNRPAARSAPMMGACGQRAVLGFNLTKLVRGLAEQSGIPLAA